ncbi:MAG: hypothetical protein AB1454_09820 [Candidatus Auribacterota bacterium]|uniref:Uncharacterized protein n=1 Tax=Candidatus Auribacter fodinae TaxID=2093366 RepID=A0A3A4R3Y5_9BACT|nr:MAG: hypothetical protein C4541_03455 [Candidatus Auribacter fodinae]
MTRTIYITCPHCKALIEAETDHGKVIKSFPHDGEADSDKDRFLSEMEKIKKSDQTREERFNQSKKEEEKKKDKLSELFKKETDRVKKEGDIKPELRPFDLD